MLFFKRTLISEHKTAHAFWTSCVAATGRMNTARHDQPKQAHRPTRPSLIFVRFSSLCLRAYLPAFPIWPAQWHSLMLADMDREGIPAGHQISLDCEIPPSLCQAYGFWSAWEILIEWQMGVNWKDCMTIAGMPCFFYFWLIDWICNQQQGLLTLETFFLSLVPCSVTCIFNDSVILHFHRHCTESFKQLTGPRAKYPNTREHKWRCLNLTCIHAFADWSHIISP